MDNKWHIEIWAEKTGERLGKNCAQGKWFKLHECDWSEKERNYIANKTCIEYPESYIVFHCADCNSITKIYWLCSTHSSNNFWSMDSNRVIETQNGGNLAISVLINIIQKCIYIEFISDRCSFILAIAAAGYSHSHSFFFNIAGYISSFGIFVCIHIRFRAICSFPSQFNGAINALKFFYIFDDKHKKKSRYLWLYICCRLASSSKCTYSAVKALLMTDFYFYVWLFIDRKRQKKYSAFLWWSEWDKMQLNYRKIDNDD